MKNNKCRQGRREKEILALFWLGCIIIGAPIMANSMEGLQKTKNRTFISSRNFTHGCMSKENKNTNLERDTYAPMSIAAFFIFAKIWKQPKCPSTDERIKITHIHTYTQTEWNTSQP